MAKADGNGGASRSRGWRADLRVLALVLAVVGASCSGGDGSADGTPDAAESSTTTDPPGSTTTPLEPFSGPGDFYDLPDPLPAGDPGRLIRYQAVEGASAPDRELWRVMYHSRDAQDRDVAVTGLVSVPTAPAPEDGWPVLSWGHGTSGMAPQCAPSRSAEAVPTFGTEGIVVASDYVGLGPNGQRHAYLSGSSEGHSVIDAVRSAGQLPGVEAADEWTTVGVSQGGHAVLFASELAATYAPELELLGTVAMAPATELDRTFPGDTPQFVAVIKAMAVYGLAVDHPDLRPEDYASAALQDASATLDRACIGETSVALAAIPAEEHWTTDPLSTDTGREIAEANNPGATVFDAPLLIVQGDADIVVVPARTDAYLERICGQGQSASLTVLPGAGHDLDLDDARAGIPAWLDDRLAGRPAPSGCAEASLGSPLADQTPPRGTNGMAFDDDGRLWIADLAGGQILAVDPEDGSILVRLGRDQGVNAPDDLAFDAQGRLWWTDNALGDVGRIDDPAGPGAASETVATLGPGANPIAVAEDGAVLVARTLAADALYRLDPDDPGDPHLVADEPGQLNGFAFGPDGMLYAPRFVDGAGVVSAIDPATGEATDLVAGLPLAVSVEVAGDGTLRVLTVAPATVWTVDPETGEHRVLGELPGEVADNQAIDADGELWVSAFDRPLVWRVAADGSSEPAPVSIGRP